MFHQFSCQAIQRQKVNMILMHNQLIVLE
uniref:Uncharacterized protein n=1 Tax=Arundo donax TaxID=35708 RepID=A0A0A9FMP9_ARUDO